MTPNRQGNWNENYVKPVSFWNCSILCLCVRHVINISLEPRALVLLRMRLLFSTLLYTESPATQQKSQATAVGIESCSVLVTLACNDVSE